MNSRAPTVCLDSNLFISFLRGDEPTSRAGADVLTDAAKGGIHAVTSSLAIVETVHLSNPSAPESDVEATIRSLDSPPWLKIWNLDTPSAREASRLSRR